MSTTVGDTTTPEYREFAGKVFIQNYLKGKTVSTAKFDEDLNKHIADGIKALRGAFMTWFKGGSTSYLSFLGEERAFGDGKQPYTDLVAAIQKKGESLDEVDAKKEEAKKATEATPETPITTPTVTTGASPTVPTTEEGVK